MIELSVLVSRGIYSATSLLALGLALHSCYSASINTLIEPTTRRWSGRTAMASLLVSVAWFICLVAELDDDWSAIADPSYYEILYNSPAGELMLIRNSALASLVLWSLDRKFPRVLALVSALLVSFSFTRYGHSLTEPVLIKSALLWIHLTVIAWWFSVVPLLILLLKTSENQSIDFAQRFGDQAIAGVAVVVISGLMLGALQMDHLSWSTEGAYALTLVLKLALVSIILVIGLINARRVYINRTRFLATGRVRAMAILGFDFIIFLSVIYASTWLTGPASNT